MLITVTDIAGTSGTATIDSADVTETITPWYPDMPTEIAQSIDKLQTALDRHDNTGDLENYLGIMITVPDFDDIPAVLMVVGVDADQIRKTLDGLVTITRSDANYVIIGEDNGWYDFTTYSSLGDIYTTDGSNDLTEVARDIAAWAKR